MSGAPKLLAVADVETTRLCDGAIPRTLFWGLAVDGEPYRRFETSRELLAFLAHRDGDLLVYSHHHFDLIQLMVDRQPIKIRDVRSRTILRADVAGCEWRNSLAIYPSTLATILESCGYTKPGLDDLEARNEADTVDALAAFKALNAIFRDVWDVEPLGGKSLTAASVAFRSAELTAGPMPVYLEDRDTYRGGRVEAFRVDDVGEADCWDINSSYPSAFLDAPASDTLYWLEVDVATTGPGPLFWLRPDKGKLLFPRGRFVTCVWASNYERYIEPHDGIRGVTVIDTKRCDLTWLGRVGGLVESCYTQRLAAKARGDAAVSYAIKIGLNSI